MHPRREVELEFRKQVLVRKEMCSLDLKYRVLPRQSRREWSWFVRGLSPSRTTKLGRILSLILIRFFASVETPIGHSCPNQDCLIEQRYG